MRGSVGVNREELSVVIPEPEPRQVKMAMAVVRASMNGAGPELLGQDLELARATFARNLIGDGYPGFWMEAPLLGETGFDFHVCYDRPDLPPGVRFAPGAGYG